ncbi:MAG TPA: peptide transporter [Clostridiaceae bacterium]|nr:peptide transporter [Clostridiaceae bacterium]
MTNQKKNEHIFAGIDQLSLRSLIIGAMGSAVITASSMYIALRLSALPWPIIFVSVLSMALLKALGKTTLNEINITQTSMSAGSMVAGGLAFTLPGLWMSGIWEGEGLISEHLWKVIAVALAGTILGTVLTWFLRPKFVERDNLPYPIGMAAAETISAGDKGGKKSVVLFGTMAFSALFTYLRDNLKVIPSLIQSQWLISRNFFVSVWVSPMAGAIGYLIGSLYTMVWFIGAVLSYVIIIPFGPALGVFESVDAATSFAQTAGIGLMVGTGLGVVISFVVAFIKKQIGSKSETKASLGKSDKPKSNKTTLLTVIAIGISFVLSVVCGLGPVASILLIIGVFIVSAMAATLTGETGINPMEIFAIIVLLGIRLLVNLDAASAFFAAACVAVACGYAGDLLNDYKAGHVIGTNPVAQLISQVVGGIIGSVVAAIVMFAVIGRFGGVGPGTELSAGQAYAVSQMVNGIGNPLVFAIAAIAGVLLYLLKVPAMTLGIGMYLPFYISSAVVIGGVVRFILDRIRPQSQNTGNVAASGIFGGEGIAGVTDAIIKMIIGG